jgi:hypothetical protein
MDENERDRGEGIEESLRDAAGKRIEDQGTEGGLTEATHGGGDRNPLRREGVEPERDEG